jgi:aconitate hydratase
VQEINDLMREAFDAETYRRLYSDFEEKNPLWNEIPTTTGNVYQWEPDSTYIREPPYFEGFTARLGHSLTSMVRVHWLSSAIQ